MCFLVCARRARAAQSTPGSSGLPPVALPPTTGAVVPLLPGLAGGGTCARSASAMRLSKESAAVRFPTCSSPHDRLERATRQVHSCDPTHGERTDASWHSLLGVPFRWGSSRESVPRQVPCGLLGRHGQLCPPAHEKLAGTGSWIRGTTIGITSRPSSSGRRLSSSKTAEVRVR